MTIYGHRELNIFFRPFIEIYGDGFSYSGKKYLWADIRKIDTGFDKGKWNWLFGVVVGIPKAKVELIDGRSFKINSRIIERKGEKPSIDFLSNKSDVYEELVGLLVHKSGEKIKDDGGI